MRALGVLERAWIDPGGRGEPQRVRRIALNACAFRRDVLREHPFPEDAGAFGADVHLEGLVQSGHVFLFDHRMKVTHAFDGWGIERDLRRHRGRIAIDSRRREPRLRHAWLARVGPLAIPAIVVGFALRDWATCLRLGRDYGLRWHELPVALALALPVRVLEIPGMLDALRGRAVPGSLYR